MIVAAGLEHDVETAEERCRIALADGSAMEKFLENAAAQGGDLAELDAMDGSARAAHSREIIASKSGFVTGIDAYSVGMAGVALGVGRDTAADPVEPLAGIELFRKTGEEVTAGEPVMRLWAEDEGRLDDAESRLEKAVDIGSDRPPTRKSMILREIAPE
jgi:pyrimidine-nucleoside phosphorylase